MLADSSPTPYDVRFRLFGVPVRILPMFWVIAFLLGGYGEVGPALAWMLAVLLSVLVHELGHALLQRAFGGAPSIVLHGFGGVAFAPGVNQSPWRNIFVSLAGPIAGFALAAIAYAVDRAPGVPQERLVLLFIAHLKWINVAWSVLNLAPIWPLDGGQIARELLTLIMPVFRGIVASLLLSIVVAVTLGGWLAWSTRSTWNAALFALLAVQNYQALAAYLRSRDR